MFALWENIIGNEKTNFGNIIIDGIKQTNAIFFSFRNYFLKNI